MIGLERQRRFEIALPAGERFARRAEDQVERERTARAAARTFDGRCDLLRPMIALEQRQLGRVERLGAQADSRHAAGGQHGHALGVEIGRVGFDAELVAGLRRKPAAHQGEQAVEGRRQKVGQRAAAEEEGVRPAADVRAPSQLAFDRFDR